ncbi:PLP-dependent aminotransferase family protein [Chitinimonas sp.]|uniref:aminotransferase-like domain-containing protein n=1 Tax=Chitinimonas sp. TaxID=1934313 RepID=UPI0035B0A7B8
MSQITRYQQLADDLAGRIQAGVLQAGERLPSVRQLCSLHDASPATVTHALHRLEDDGLIEARPRLGFYVRQRQFGKPTQCARAGLPTAIALEGHRKLAIELAHGDDRDRLTLPSLAPELFPAQAIKKQLIQLLQRDTSILNDSSYGGQQRLREQIARRSLMAGCDFRPDEVVVTHGDTEALDICLRVLTKPGDVVAAPTPGPLRVLEQLEGHGLQALEVPAHPVHGMSVDALAALLRENRVAACIVNANFPSPTGSLMPDAEKARLAELAHAHGVPLIEVDTFGDLHHGAQRPRAVKAFDRHDNVLYCVDLGFLISPGLRLGYIAAGKHRLVLDAARVVHGEPVAALIQEAIGSFMASGRLELHLRRLRSQLAAQYRSYRVAVLRHFPAGTRVAQGTGGFMLWLELPGDIDAVELLRRCQRLGLSFVPGVLCSLDSSFSNCLRLNAGHPLGPAIEDAISRIGEQARTMLDEADIADG